MTYISLKIGEQWQPTFFSNFESATPRKVFEFAFTFANGFSTKTYINQLVIEEQDVGEPCSTTQGFRQPMDLLDLF
jgi:hypothetical protein